MPATCTAAEGTPLQTGRGKLILSATTLTGQQKMKNLPLDSSDGFLRYSPNRN